jgi:hypothetical protein
MAIKNSQNIRKTISRTTRNMANRRTNKSLAYRRADKSWANTKTNRNGTDR